MAAYSESLACIIGPWWTTCDYQNISKVIWLKLKIKCNENITSYLATSTEQNGTLEIRLQGLKLCRGFVWKFPTEQLCALGVSAAVFCIQQKFKNAHLLLRSYSSSVKMSHPPLMVPFKRSLLTGDWWLCYSQQQRSVSLTIQGFREQHQWLLMSLAVSLWGGLANHTQVKARLKSWLA